MSAKSSHVATTRETKPARGMSTRSLYGRRQGAGGRHARRPHMADMLFCAYQYQHLPLDALRKRWLASERAGFDVLWNCDTVVEPDRPGHTMFDGPATLTMMAADTSHIRV